MKALVGAFNLEKALVGAFSVIVKLHRLIVYGTGIFTAQQQPDKTLTGRIKLSQVAEFSNE